jgi:hypothetical protein
MRHRHKEPELPKGHFVGKRESALPRGGFIVVGSALSGWPESGDDPPETSAGLALPNLAGLGQVIRRAKERAAQIDSGEDPTQDLVDRIARILDE